MMRCGLGHRGKEGGVDIAECDYEELWNHLFKTSVWRKKERLGFERRRGGRGAGVGGRK